MEGEHLQIQLNQVTWTNKILLKSCLCFQKAQRLMETSHLPGEECHMVKEVMASIYYVPPECQNTLLQKCLST